MNATMIDARTGLADIYAPFREAMAEYQRVAERDGRKAEDKFAEVQQIYKAWAAGGEHAREMLRQKLKESLGAMLQDGSIAPAAFDRIAQEFGDILDRGGA